MYRNLSPLALKITGRQSEMIELAMTYGFAGFDIDIDRVATQVRRGGVDKAKRLIESAKIELGGFELPIHWKGPEAKFRQEMPTLEEIAVIAGRFGALRCLTTVEAASDDLPFQENFEQHRERLSAIGETLGKQGIRLGLAFRAPAHHRSEAAHSFIAEVEQLLALIDAIGNDHVGVVVDTFHWHFGGGKPEDVKKLPVEKIIAVRAADLPGDLDPQSVTEEQAVLPETSGTVDVSGYIVALQELGYDGPVSPYAHRSELEGETRESIVAAAAESLDKAWQAAGIPIPKRLNLRVPATTEEAAGEASEEASVEENGKATEGGEGTEESSTEAATSESSS